ncbi:hypothetical protein [Arsenicibacter rosenii]|uniref:Uncharacterized protein n=1 Tax=Arsenicibacter rosenii TaxID=1750698 RepID=A0A1S2VM14_9BACT|nr:hypothetical protein [Arsenicibacter rosenii]OIN59802.1 hypothetical protein BLX24_08060 [Arsenicibacter rosenii]
MTDLERLTAWLEAPVYPAGVLLYERLIGTGFVLSVLKAGEDSYSRSVLEAALSEKHAQLLAEQQARQQELPPVLAEGKLRAGKLLDERIVLKERMRLLHAGGTSSGDQLRELAFQVLALNDQLDEHFGQQDFYEQHGYLPDADPPSCTTPLALTTRRNTLRTYVTRYSKQLQQAYGAGEISRLQHKLDHYRAELFAVETELQKAAAD